MDVSWIKIYIDWYDSRKIKYLRKLPKGNEYALLWIMVLSLAGKSNNGGKLTITDDLPYTLEELSNELGFKAQIVKQGFTEFLKLGMVIQENDSYIIANWEEYQNIDGLDKIREQNRKRVQKYREKNKGNVTCNVTSNVTVTHCNAIDKEEEIDIEKDKELSKKELIRKRSTDPLYGRQ